MSPNLRFGEYLAELRERANLTLRQAADEIGVTNAYISQIEHGKREPPRPTLLIKFAAAYKAEAIEILDRAGYLWPRTKRNARLLSQDLPELLKSPSLKKKLDSRWSKHEQEWTRLREMNRKVAHAELDRMNKEEAKRNQEYEGAISDPEIAFARDFKEKNPELPRQARELISELYMMYTLERKMREALEKEFRGEVSIIWIKRSS